MTSSQNATPPSVSWAQRNAHVFLKFNIESLKPDINIEKNSVIFKGTCAADQKLYEVHIPLFAEIDPAKSSYVNKGRFIDLILTKAQTNEPFWPTLTSDKKKHHWLKVDFERWQDEDESEGEIDDMNDMFSNKLGDFGDDDDLYDTSSIEEEDLPDVK